MKPGLATFLLWISLAAFAWAQSGGLSITNPPAERPVTPAVFSEKIRQDCITGRRVVCGRILKILPEGLIVESGYPSLRRAVLHGSWLIPGDVAAERDPSLVEGREADALCVGLVLLTDAPRSRRAKPKAYDYVVIEGFPAGHFSYASVGSVRRGVRRFSAVLENAVKIDRAAALAAGKSP